MFAFALWDREQRQLHLVRDRLGEKPLYYGWMGTSFLFGSELKSLNAYPGFRAPINRSALALYFRHNCVPAPHSIYEGIFKLPPATVLTLDCSKGSPVPCLLVILEHAGSSRERASKPVCWFRNRCRRRTGETSGRIRAIENDCRCSARRFPLRRHRLFCRRGI